MSIVQVASLEEEPLNNEEVPSASSDSDRLGGHLWEHTDSMETVVHRPNTVRSEEEHAVEADDEFESQSRGSTSSHHQTAVEVWFPRQVE